MRLARGIVGSLYAALAIDCKFAPLTNYPQHRREALRQSQSIDITCDMHYVGGKYAGELQ
jgi:hypothetical protein